jgi:hypothetical protein
MARNRIYDCNLLMKFILIQLHQILQFTYLFLPIFAQHLSSVKFASKPTFAFMSSSKGYLAYQGQSCVVSFISFVVVVIGQGENVDDYEHLNYINFSVQC